MENITLILEFSLPFCSLFCTWNLVIINLISMILLRVLSYIKENENSF